MHLKSRSKLPPDVVTICAKDLEGLLLDVQNHLRPYLSLLHRCDAADTGSKYIQGLLSRLPRKSAEPISELFDTERKVFQRFVGQAPWSDTKIRQHMQLEIGQEIAEEDGVICLDPSSFAKKGSKSVGVARQWSGRQGKVDNCQVGVFASYASRKGSALLDGQLYIPQDWIDDENRREDCRIPEGQRHLKRWEIADELLLQVSDLPHFCVLADAEFGRCGAWRDRLEHRGERYILDIPTNMKVQIIRDGNIASEACSAISWAKGKPTKAWLRVQTRVGSQGPMVFSTCRIPVATLRRDGTIRREILLAFFPTENPSDLHLALTNIDESVSLEVLVQYATRRYTIEHCFERAKGECGMAHYEVRSWVGWHHHMTLSMLAAWILEKLRLTKSRDFPPSDVSVVRADCCGDDLQPDGRSRKACPNNLAQDQPNPVGNVLSCQAKTALLQGSGDF